MSVVIGIIALVTLNYWQLVRAFPQGGGSPEQAAGRAFGEEWSFLPIGALVVDFALNDIGISIAARRQRGDLVYLPARSQTRIHSRGPPAASSPSLPGRTRRTDGVRRDDLACSSSPR